MKKLISALACIMAVLFVISCGSTPEAEPEPTVKDAVEEIKKDVEETVDFSAANKSLLALTEAARQSAIEFGAEKYFSDGFSVAETKYTSIKNNIETDSSKDYSAEIKDLTARYNSLASASQASALKEKADALSLANENQKAYDDGKKALEEYSAFGADKDGATLLAKANEALASVRDGEDFAEVAKKYSEDSSASSGGELSGTFDKGHMVQEISDVVFSLKKGEFSEVLDYNKGYYIFYVRNRMEENLASLEELSEGIKSHLQEQEHDRQIQDMEEKMLEEAEFKIYNRTLKKLLKEEKNNT